MHTDEYEISLSRELAVCRSTIRRIKEFLAIMERKHNMSTEAFLEEVQSGRSAVPAPDLAAWQDNGESLKKWEELERQYEELFRLMKI